MSARKSSHRTIFLIVSSGSPLALIASSLRSTSKKPFCPMTRPLHPPITACGHRVRFVGTWREEFFEAPRNLSLCFCLPAAAPAHPHSVLEVWRDELRHLSTTPWRSCRVPQDLEQIVDRREISILRSGRREGLALPRLASDRCSVARGFRAMCYWPHSFT